MRKFISAALVLLVTTLGAVTGRAVEDTWDYSVRISSAVQASPATITLTWPQDTNGVPTSYTVYRKAPGATAWGSGAALPGSATSYADTGVAVGTAYEYRVVKVAGSYTGYGYIQTGIDVPLVDSRGKVVLVVDNTYAAQLAPELTRLQQDLAGDGWTVLRHDVGRTDSVASVKNLIKADYAADPANVKSVFLFGHVPVPYSGQLNPDGHPDHVGAWPADVYYGDMDGNWTDSTVNYTQTVNTDPADAARLTNVPGDGKFDQTTIPSAVELQVGRVDLANLPGRLTWGGPATFPDEQALLRQYLNKDHNFRHRLINVQRRAIVGDYFGVRGGEAFSSSAHGAFAAFFGANGTTNLNVLDNDTQGVWVPALAAGDYLFAYGCGAGSYSTISGLGNAANYNGTTTPEIVGSDIHAVFTLLFGSWLGDWDHEDDILRSVLATPTDGLAAAWSGRPHWFVHPMGLGETIGYTARLTQNNTGLYQNQIDSSANYIHIALMGDPTLRLHPVAPVAGLGGSLSGTTAGLAWTPSPDTVVGYNVYRATSANGPFTKLTGSPIAGTTFSDASAPAGATYMVRAVKLESTTSGSYYNASQGVFWTVGGASVPTVDTTAPAVQLTTPLSDGTLSGSGVTVSANASDDVGVVGVQFKLDGVNLGAEDLIPPFSTTWDTTFAANGPHTLTAVARDLAGNQATAATISVTVNNASASSVAWIDDSLPAGAGPGANGGDGWNWVGANPAPFSGTVAHQSNLATGLHEHFFNWAGVPLNVAAGDVLFTYVYLDPANPPGEIMLSWGATDWEHRAYWGSNEITYGAYGTPARYYMGPLPATGQWVRLEVPASAVALEGAAVQGMCFSAYNGRVTWDYTGKSSQATPPPPALPTVTVAATDATATVGDNTDTAVLTFTRTGDTSTALNVNFTLGGTAVKWTDYRTTDGDMPVALTIPAGSGTATMTIAAVANSTNANPETATVTLATDAAYSVGTQNSALLTLASSATPPPPPPPPAPTPTTDIAWVDDALPAGAGGGADGGDAWTWVSSGPAPFSGTLAHQSAIAAGLHEHYFNWAATPLTIATGDKLYAYVYLDPANPPSEIMLAWGTTDWEHRAYWGANNIAYGTDNTPGRYNMGALPAAGQWVRLDVSASAVALEGASIQAMCFSVFDGRATWDNAGKSVASATSGSSSPTPTPTGADDTVWVDDALPAGAGPSADGGDAWTWVASSPAPYSGTVAHQSAIAAGLHEHYFNWASSPLAVGTGDVLFTYVYLDPANLPSELMLSWGTTDWEHRAYWGANNIAYGTDNTPGRYYMGALPAAGQWVRLEVPANAVALEGASVQGMCFSVFDGRATWDKSGKGAAAPVFPGVSVTATDGTATIGTSDNAVLTFTRTGATTADLTVNFTLGGTAVKWDDYRTASGDMPVTITIPAGASSATMTIAAMANETNANPETATFTLAADPAYTTDTANTASITLASNATAGTGGSTGTGTGMGTGSSTGTGTETGADTGSGGTVTVPLGVAENAAMTLPNTGDNGLTLLTPTMLEVERINTKQPDPAPVDSWNFVDANGNFAAPALSEFAVTVNGQPATVASVGFKRRVRYAPLVTRDLRIDNCLYLQLATPVPDGATVAVTNPSGALWPAAMKFATAADPLRHSPAIHVNEEGYVPSFPKKAMVGYYLGSKGEMDVPASSAFTLVNAATGVSVYQGTLTARPDTGYTYSPTPYQKVLMADFSNFTTPGEYELVVPGLGASFPFLIDDGIAMGFLRTYELGLYHQRCGTTNEMPYTRFVHDACHTAPAEVPSPQSSYQFTWTTIATKNADTGTTDPAGAGPQLKDEASQLYPFVNKGAVDVAGGHHDAGDYSKYTINSAQLTHELMFTADSIAGASDLDNLGIPESGDGIGDIMQEAKQEADYLAKLQDADGGFYFIVYPKNREYENNVTPDHGDTQVVWPKNTSATAAATAALAQCASSPKFKTAYPAVAANYLAKAKLGWQFLMNAIAKYGKDGAYQKITFYGDNWTHNDEIAWAACELYLATGDSQYSKALADWFPNPADPNTFKWGWWRCSESWGNAIRSYAFAVRSGRLTSGQVDANYLAACETQIKAAGDDALAWSNQNAYGSSFPTETKHVMSAGWYFSLDQASDMAAAYQLDPRPEYLDALVANMNYEGGTNPVNVAYLTGIGLKRQHEIVNQYALNDRRVLPPDGIPLGNVQSNFDFLSNYGAQGNELAKLSFPSDSGTNSPYPFYDRWADTWNVTTEFISVNQARSVMALACLASQTAAKSTPWKSSTAAQIVVPSAVAQVGVPVTLSLVAPGLDLGSARITWEARDQQPDFGATYTVSPKNNGVQWVEAEIEWPDGRRAFATNTFSANAPVITWVDDALPAGASTQADGGDSWNWVSGGPAPYAGTLAHQSAIAAGLHEHGFNDTTTPLVIDAGDTLFAYVYLDPANPPSEIMLHWNDGTWEHRAYWGANTISYGTFGTVSRSYIGALPAAGQWVRLEVPASVVGLEGSTVKGMCFSCFDGRATWDAAGKTSPAN